MKGNFKRLAALAVAATMLCPTFGAFAAGEKTNVALGIVPTQTFSSSTTGNLSTLTDGIKGDGNSSTSWFIRADYHAKQNPGLVFDLGTAAKVSSFVVTGSTKAATDTTATHDYSVLANYDILYSNDNSSWTTAAEVRNNEDYEHTTEIADITARYWKVLAIFKTTDTGERARVCEIEIYGVAGEKPAEAEKPTVTMTDKTAQLDDGESVTVSATAECSSSDIKTVQFFNGDEKLADGVLTDGEWQASISPAAGEYLVTAKATTEAGGVGTSDSMRVRVHSENITNIALKKLVTANHGSTADSYPEALVDGITNQGSGSYKWIANASNANGAWAEIDLASGIDNLFLISSIVVRSAYADTSSTDILKSFTLSYYDGSKWVDAVTEEASGNTYTHSFSAGVPATRVKITSHQSSTFRVRELEVMGRLYKLPKLSVISSESAIYEDETQIKVKAEDAGAGIGKIEAMLNGKAAETEIAEQDGEYTITVKGLSKGENKITVRAYDGNGKYSETDEISVVYYSSEDFIADFGECKTVADVGKLVKSNVKLLALEDGDYEDTESYGSIYEKLLENKANIASASDFATMFKTECALGKINAASDDEIIEIIRKELSSVKLGEYDALSEEVQKAVAKQLAAADITNAAQLENELGVQIALQSIKYTAWTNIETVLEAYKDRLQLTNYSDYTNLTSAKQTAANKYIASMNSSDKMNTLAGFSEIFKDAVEEGERYTSSGSGGGGGGGGSSSIKVTGPVETSAPIAEELKPYDDVDKTHANWAAITYLAEKGVMTGDGNKQFAPERTLKREEFARILVDGFFTADENAVTTFADVNESDWFYKYVATGQQMGLIAGIEQYWFGSGDYVTREQMAVLCYRAAIKAGKSFADEGESQIPADEEKISSYAYYPIKILRMNGIFGGGEVRPTEYATRAEAAQLLYEIMLMEG